LFIGNKRERLAALLNRCGGLALLERVKLYKALLVLNYHRVMLPEECGYDRAVVSATPEEFQEQVNYLRSHFEIIGLPQLMDHLEGRNRHHGPRIMITFDDGYIDNYTIAFPVLRDARVPATFFLPTSYIGSDRIPWWDQIASLLRRAKAKTIHLDYPEPRGFSLDKMHLDETIRAVLKLYKSPAMQDPERFGNMLEGVCGVNREERAGMPLFLNWAQAREMQRTGMSFGSHTHSHRILSKLDWADQVEELRGSRETMEQQLTCEVRAVAIPVGLRDSFNRDTERALVETGYRVAFSFYDGVNHLEDLHWSDIRRTGVELELSLRRFRFKAALAVSMGRVW
jgi:peptidoglycan/xylan/chitin deacetylase (PgdA/CDA1 family)